MLRITARRLASGMLGTETASLSSPLLTAPRAPTMTFRACDKAPCTGACNIENVSIPACLVAAASACVEFREHLNVLDLLLCIIDFRTGVQGIRVALEGKKLVCSYQSGESDGVHRRNTSSVSHLRQFAC